MGVLLTPSEVQIVTAEFGQPEDDRVNYEVRLVCMYATFSYTFSYTYSYTYISAQIKLLHVRRFARGWAASWAPLLLSRPSRRCR
jgi:hypothetical protein